MNKIITAALVGAGISVSVNAALPPTLNAPVTYRDFTTRAALNPAYFNPNFEKSGPISGLETGIVQSTKGVGPVPPTFNNPPPIAVPGGGPSSVTTAADFNEWWSPTVDNAPGNAPIASSLTLNLSSTIGPQYFGALYGTVGIYTFSDTTFFPLDGLGSKPAAPSVASGGYWG